MVGEEMESEDVEDAQQMENHFIFSEVSEKYVLATSVVFHILLFGL